MKKIVSEFWERQQTPSPICAGEKKKIHLHNVGLVMFCAFINDVGDGTEPCMQQKPLGAAQGHIPTLETGKKGGIPSSSEGNTSSCPGGGEIPRSWQSPELLSQAVSPPRQCHQQQPRLQPAWNSVEFHVFHEDLSIFFAGPHCSETLQLQPRAVTALFVLLPLNQSLRAAKSSRKFPELSTVSMNSLPFRSIKCH